MQTPAPENFNDWERLASLELYKEYGFVLRERRLKLRLAAIELCDSDRFWGKWDPVCRTIYISRKLLREYPWFHVLAVLRHEVAHQLVDENLGGEKDGKIHGEVFKEACRKLGVPPDFARATVHLEQKTLDWKANQHDDLSEKMLERVRKLLNLASSNNEHEALLAMNRVREIYARYNLDQAQVTTEKPQFVHLIIQTGKKRLTTPEQKIIGILVGHFFVQVIVGREFDIKSGNQNRTIEVIGTRQNVLMAEYVYHFLREQSKQIVDQVSREKRLLLRSRKSFHLGILEGFDEKLSLKAHVNEVDSAISQALAVFRGDKRLDGYISEVYPRLTRLSSQARLGDSSAYNAGKKAGREITLNRPIQQRATKFGGFLK